MSYNYDKLYSQTPNALGAPNALITEFFNGFPVKNALVLDVGCGQGRDAISIAMLGHTVVGVDISNNGIKDLTREAHAKNLLIEGVVADISTYRPEGEFDVIVIDRTLHMLADELHDPVLSRLLDHVTDQGWVLILDESSNIKTFVQTLHTHAASWRIDQQNKGILFVQKQ